MHPSPLPLLDVVGSAVADPEGRVTGKHKKGGGGKERKERGREKECELTSFKMSKYTV